MRKPSPNRHLRMADQIQVDLSNWLIRAMSEYADLKVGGLVSVTEVQLNRDMSQAKVFFSVLYDNEKEQVAQFLNQKAPYLRSVLSQKISVYKMPALVFVYDNTELEAAKINVLLKQVLPSPSSIE